MKTFRFIGMALFAILMCVNFTSCSGSDDDPTEEPEEGGVIVNSKKIAKIVGESEVGESEIYTFKYDYKGRLIEGTEERKNRNNTEDWGCLYTYIWGDDVIRYTYDTTTASPHSWTFFIEDGLIQRADWDYTFIYNESKRLVRIEDTGENTNAIWDDNKLVYINHNKGSWETTATYEKSSKKGYSPFIAAMIGLDGSLFMAHPEIAGIRTTQLPASTVETDRSTNKYTYTYEFDKDDYISKMIKEGSDGSLWTYTLTWK